MKNVHDIAIELEYLLCEEFGFADRPRGTIFDADDIESRTFYDNMALLLHKKAKKDYTDFINSIFDYKGVNMNQISDYEKIFEEFKSYLQK